jgi:transcriptional regulator with XRE-family HTH domain
MKPLEKQEKDAIKLRYAVALSKLLEKSEIKSLKKLAHEAGMEPSHVQKIAAGSVDVALTTNFALARAFGISYTDFAATFERVAEKDIQDFIQKQEKLRKHKGKPKLPLLTSNPVKRKGA